MGHWATTESTESVVKHDARLFRIYLFFSFQEGEERGCACARRWVEPDGSVGSNSGGRRGGCARAVTISHVLLVEHNGAGCSARNFVQLALFVAPERLPKLWLRLLQSAMLRLNAWALRRVSGQVLQRDVEQ
eukprot:COSAG01_NODE_18305_length_1085_cov_32.752535_1_plen_131_part_01